jgi:hypothetical protein
MFVEIYAVMTFIDMWPFKPIEGFHQDEPDDLFSMSKGHAGR